MKGLLDAGELVPDDVVSALVREGLAQADTLPGFILDGFPRTDSQALELDAILSDLGREPLCVVCLEVSEAELVRRILSRGEGRADDNEETVRNRLGVYQRDTKPMLDHYAQSVVCLDGTGSMDEIEARIGEALGL